MIITGGDKLKDFINKIAKQKARVDIGFFKESKFSNGTFVAEIAIYQEYGTKHIPPRPFMQPTFDDNKTKWVKIIKNTTLTQGKDINLKQILSTVGVVAMNDIKNKINWWAKSGLPRNAQSTINKKGFDSPLIDNGAMRDAVIFKISE